MFDEWSIDMFTTKILLRVMDFTQIFYLKVLKKKIRLGGIRRRG